MADAPRQLAEQREALLQPGLNRSGAGSGVPAPRASVAPAPKHKTPLGPHGPAGRPAAGDGRPRLPPEAGAAPAVPVEEDGYDWVAPSGQSGDGSSKLNAKFGY